MQKNYTSWLTPSFDVSIIHPRTAYVKQHLLSGACNFKQSFTDLKRCSAAICIGKHSELEIHKLFGKVTQDGYTLIPLSLYFSGSRVKMELGLCKGKKLYDKREADAKRQADRTIERFTKERDRY